MTPLKLGRLGEKWLENQVFCCGHAKFEVYILEIQLDKLYWQHTRRDQGYDTISGLLGFTITIIRL